MAALLCCCSSWQAARARPQHTAMKRRLTPVSAHPPAVDVRVARGGLRAVADVYGRVGVGVAPEEVGPARVGRGGHGGDVAAAAALRVLRADGVGGGAQVEAVDPVA